LNVLTHTAVCSGSRGVCTIFHAVLVIWKHCVIPPPNILYDALRLYLQVFSWMFSQQFPHQLKEFTAVVYHSFSGLNLWLKKKLNYILCLRWQPRFIPTWRINLETAEEYCGTWCPTINHACWSERLNTCKVFASTYSRIQVWQEGLFSVWCQS
jgi:hypothetical protein